MKTYEYNGRLFRFADDKVPAGAKLHTKEKAPEKVEAVKADEPEKAEPKAKKSGANKARKVRANK